MPVRTNVSGGGGKQYGIGIVASVYPSNPVTSKVLDVVGKGILKSMAITITSPRYYYFVIDGVRVTPNSIYGNAQSGSTFFDLKFNTSLQVYCSSSTDYHLVYELNGNKYIVNTSALYSAGLVAYATVVGRGRLTSVNADSLTIDGVNVYGTTTQAVSINSGTIVCEVEFTSGFTARVYSGGNSLALCKYELF